MLGWGARPRRRPRSRPHVNRRGRPRAPPAGLPHPGRPAGAAFFNIAVFNIAVFNQGSAGAAFGRWPGKVSLTASLPWEDVAHREAVMTEDAKDVFSDPELDSAPDLDSAPGT